MITDTEIRKYHGHGDGECRVRISRDGEVFRRGFIYDLHTRKQTMKTWILLGDRDEVVAKMKAEIDFKEALDAISGWDGSSTCELESLVDDAESVAYDIAWDDERGELDEGEYSSMCDEIHQAAGSTGNGYPDYPEWPTLVEAGKDGLLLVISEDEPGEQRMSVYIQDNPEFDDGDEDQEAA